MTADTLGAERRDVLERFLERFLERNAGMNLSAARDRASLEEHVADSLSLVPFLVPPLVDVGSGGGFPGLVLAIATSQPVTLVEATAKKARFLEETAREFGLDVRVRAERAEDAARDPALRETFGSATARAVASAPAVLELTIPFLVVGGRALLQRGALDAPERTALGDAALVLGAEIEREVEFERDGGDERRILIVRKVAPTGPRFPRRAGIPAKRPLCFEGFRRA